MKNDFFLPAIIFVVAVGLIAAYTFAVQNGYAVSRMIDSDYSEVYRGLPVNSYGATNGLIVANGNTTLGSPTPGTDTLNVVGNVQSSGSFVSTKLCVSGYTRVGLWCIDNDGNLLTLRSSTLFDSDYVSVDTVAGAKAVLVKTRAQLTSTYDSAVACVRPGNILNISCYCGSTPGACTLSGGAVPTVDMTTETVLTSGNLGTIKTRCALIGPATGDCYWFLEGYLD